MPGIADQLLERRTKLITQAREILQRAIDEDRDLTADEKLNVDARTAEAGELSQRAATFREADQDARDIEESFRSLEQRPAEQIESRGGDTFGTWARSTRNGDGLEVSTRNFAGYARELRAMSASGGVGQKDVSSKLWEYMVSMSQIIEAGAEVIRTSDGNALPLPRITAHADTSDTPVSASGALGDSDSTADTVNLTVAKYTFKTLIPSELFADANWDVSGYIARNAGRQLGKRVQKQASAATVAGFTTAGSTGPTGTSTSFGTQSTAGQGADLLIDLLHSVAIEHRAMGSAWVMNDTTAGILEKLKTSTGEYVWQDALTDAAAGRIKGKPVYIDPFMAVPAANAKSVFYGNWDALKVRIAGDLRFERSDQFAFANDQICFRAIVRTGAVALDTAAVKHFAHSAT